MTGLDKILQQIKNESLANAKAIIDEANEKAEQIVNDAETASEAECDSLLRKADEDIKIITERADSARELNKKQQILIKKQEILISFLNKAKEKILSFNDNEYFSFMAKILEKMPAEGIIFFNSADLKRINDSFKSYLTDKNITVSTEPIDISGGFIIKYGDIEENCSLDALFESEKENLTYKVSKLIFG